MCLTDIEIMFRCVRSVQLTVNFKCLLSLKNLLFYHVPTVFYFHSCSPFPPLLATIGSSVSIFSCPLFSLLAYSVLLHLKKKPVPETQNITAGTIFECLKCDRTSGNWFIFSSLLHSLIRIRKLNLVVFSFPFLLLIPCPSICHDPSWWVLLLLRHGLMVSGHHVHFELEDWKSEF